MPQEGGPPPPFLLPPFLSPGGGALPPGLEEIEEISHAEPDGSVCTTTLVWSGERKLKRNTTRCSQPKTTPARRTQMMLPGMLPLPGVSPTANTWVLGGVFLENFVVILDFEHKRMGFAEPLAATDPDFGVEHEDRGFAKPYHVEDEPYIAPPALHP